MDKLPDWTGEVVGKLHVYGVSQQEFADYLGLNRKYLSSILNGHDAPPRAQERLLTALKDIIKKKEGRAANAQNQG